eukprot:608424-Alexandrium_andersonii.AAC.1
MLGLALALPHLLLPPPLRSLPLPLPSSAASLPPPPPSPPPVTGQGLVVCLGLVAGFGWWGVGLRGLERA